MDSWDPLRAAAGREASGLCTPLPPGPGCCTVCRGPAQRGYPRCFRCSLHRRCAPGLLADVVVPVSYSIAGTAHARRLREYKSDGPARAGARAALRTLLLVFLRDHGRCLWAGAGMAAPSHVAVVPTGCGRSGVHPLRALIEPYLALPWADLAARGDEPVQGRELLAGRFAVTGAVEGADVLLLDDTWASGSSAQSAALALKLGGARSVVTLILGRYINPAHPPTDAFVPVLGGCHFRPDSCAVHAAETYANWVIK
jgi:hypothetical protein